MDPTAVIVAVVAVIPSTLMALRAWRSAEATNQVVQGNGKGNHTVMLERLVDQVDQLVEWTESHGEEHESLNRVSRDRLRMYRREQSSLRDRLDAMDGDGK